MTGLISYTEGIPDGPNNPSNDQPLMKSNNDNIPAYVAVDHLPFNSNYSGYHNVIHQPPQGSNPAPVAGFGQLFVKNTTVGATTDTQLFFETGLGGVSQLTGSNGSTNGWVWSGGILFQWGQVIQPFPSSSNIGTTLFTIPFPSACFIVTGNGMISSTASGDLPTTGFSLNISQANLGLSGFDWQVYTSGNKYTGFTYFAIGN